MIFENKENSNRIVNKTIFLPHSPDFSPLCQLEKLNYTLTKIRDDVAENAKRIAPIAHTLHLRIRTDWETDSPLSPYAKIPTDLRSLCIYWDNYEEWHPGDPKYLPKDLRNLCLHVEGDQKSFCSAKALGSLYEHFTKLETLEIADDFIPNNWCYLIGEPFLRFLQSAKHLTELKLYALDFDDMKINDFYDRALEIIEKREDKLPLKIYYRGETIVRDNNLLQILKTRYGGPNLCSYGSP